MVSPSSLEPASHAAVFLDRKLSAAMEESPWPRPTQPGSRAWTRPFWASAWELVEISGKRCCATSVRPSRLRAAEAQRRLQREPVSRRCSRRRTRRIVSADPEMDLAEDCARPGPFRSTSSWSTSLSSTSERKTAISPASKTGCLAQPRPLCPALASQTDPAHLQGTFNCGCAAERAARPSSKTLLRETRHPPRFFTAHPTKSWALYVRHKQRRAASLIQKLQQDSPAELHDNATCVSQLEEEIRPLGGAPMNSTSSSPSCSMRVITPALLPAGALSMPCPCCACASTAP